MSILFKIFKILDKVKPAKIAYAHCDIPCGIYNSFPSMMAAQTVLKMVQKIKELPTDGTPEQMLQARNSFVRMVQIKEEHAQLCKKEILILWTDYFKPEHLKMFPELHEKVWKTCKLCSKNKQEINEESAKQLIEAVHEIGHMWDIAEEEKRKSSK